MAALLHVSVLKGYLSTEYKYDPGGISNAGL
jgi:hypothetical protein